MVAVHHAPEAWEDYARATFEAHARHTLPGRLRFLQYVDAGTIPWWRERIERGAVLLGKDAEKAKVTMPQMGLAPIAVPMLTQEDRDYRAQREAVIHTGMAASLAAAKALHEIHEYQNGRLWRFEFSSFADYCRAHWGYGKSQAFRLVQTGEIYLDLEQSRPAESTIVDSALSLPKTESQLRPLQALPKEKRADAWWSLVKSTMPAELTAKVVTRHVNKLLPKTEDHGAGEATRQEARLGEVEGLLAKLEIAIKGLPNAREITKQIRVIRRLGL